MRPTKHREVEILAKVVQLLLNGKWIANLGWGREASRLEFYRAVKLNAKWSRKASKEKRTRKYSLDIEVDDHHRLVRKL